MPEQIIPRLYRLTAISGYDTTITEIFTDAGVAIERESDLWDDGGIVSTSIDYADESVDNRVIWKQYRKG